ncbi:MAG: hypothetical protein ACRDJH_04270 [Thermomicrobiales bacterium]
MMIGAAAQSRPRENARPERDFDLMKAAGIAWVRMGFRTPFTDASMSATTPEFQAQEREVERLERHGLKVMGYSPFPGGDPDIGGHFPDWGGPMGSAAYLDFYEEVCAWLAARFQGVADAWQVANEMNRPFWNGGLPPEQGVAFLARGGRGIKRGNPGALVGVNMAGFGDVAMAMYRRLFPNDTVEFDYIGADGYMAPEGWPEKLDQLAAITDKPIVIQEFGWASKGITLTAEQTRDHPFTSAHDRCRWRGWQRTWGDHEHTPEDQAEYIARSMEIFATDPRIIGVFVWRWNDAPRCWLCGSEECPGTGNWGLVDVDERPKPSFYAFREGAALLRSRR